LKITRKRWLLITLIVIMVGVLGCSLWLMLAGRPKDLNLRLKFVRSEVVDGKSKLLFRLEGADQYDIYIKGFFYLHGNNPQIRTLVALNGQNTRQFYADPLSLSENSDPITNLKAGVFVSVLDRNFSRGYWAIKDSWSLRKERKLPMFSLAKSLWKRPLRAVYDGIITSDVITNAPLIH
jgi:hypothetical protein